jgi:hypothetical protein
MLKICRWYTCVGVDVTAWVRLPTSEYVFRNPTMGAGRKYSD